MHQRIENIDNIKGLLIILVVFGHLLEPIAGHGIYCTIYNFIYVFHMPAFILIAGMFTKLEYDKSAQFKIIQSILIPFIFFSVIYELANYKLNGTLSNYVKMGKPYWILWFLLSLFYWRIFSPILCRFKCPIVLTIILSLYFSTISYNGGILSASRTLTFFPFFLIGLIYNKKLTHLIISDKNIFLYAISIIFFVLLVFYAHKFNRDLLYASSSFPSIGLSNYQGILNRLIIYILSFLSIIFLFILASRIKGLSNIGKNSLIIYLWHGVILKLFLWRFAAEHLNSNYKICTLVITLVVSVGLAFFLANPIITSGSNYLFKLFSQLILKRRLSPEGIRHEQIPKDYVSKQKYLEILNG